MKLLAPLLLAAALSTPAKAAPLSFEGSYRFSTTERGPDGSPVCTETWAFSAPDRLTVTSGEEVVEKRFHVENDRDGDWLVTRRLATNGAPDCMGGRPAHVARDEPERRTSILRFNDGTMLVCPPPAHTDDGIPVHGGCYASLYRMN